MQALFVGLCFWFARLTRSMAMRAELWLLIGGLGVWLVVWLHSRHTRLAVEEEEELADLRRTRTSDELFEETELDTFRAKSALLVFERWLIPIFSVAIALFLFFAMWWTARLYWAVPRPGQLKAVAAGALGMVVIAFCGFIIGRYATGLAQDSRHRLLRAGGAYVMGCVLGAFLIMLALTLAHFDVRWAERFATYLIPVLMGLIGLEIILNFIMDVYRPRVPGQETRPPYDSRLLGLIAEPGGIFKTIADTLNYQFGFRVSETWFYKFMEKAIVPIIFVQVIGLWLLTSLCFVKPNEAAFIERWGQPRVMRVDREKGLRATLYMPGLHLKWPYPIERVRLVPYGRVMAVTVGSRSLDEDEKGMEQPPEQGPENEIKTSQNEDVLLWDERHVNPQKMKEIDFLAPSFQAQKQETVSATAPGSAFSTDEKSEARVPEINLVRIRIPIYYRIKQPMDMAEGDQSEPAYDYCYRNANPDQLLENLAYREICSYMSNKDMLRMISQDRATSGEELMERIQKQADADRLGVKIMYVGVSMIHPPPETAKSFQEVNGAIEEMHAKVFAAEAKALKIVPEAEGQAAELEYDAQASRTRMTVVPAAEAELFKKQLAAYNKAPHSYLVRKYFQTLVDAMKGKRLIFMPRTEDETLVIDEQEKLKSFTDVKIGE